MWKITNVALGMLVVTGPPSAGCSSDVDGGAPGNSGSSNGAEPSPSGGASGSSGTMAGDGPKGPNAKGSGGIAADCANGDEGEVVPTSPSELNAWLQQRAYTCWARESMVHDSTGPHGGKVKVFLNAALDTSMKERGEHEHPAGAVAVKELYGSGTETVTGWAVGVKSRASSDGGEGWYWYEVFSTAPGATGAIEGQGNALCSNCHAAGKDFVLVDYPLR
jgi:hypothetical protein